MTQGFVMNSEGRFHTAPWAAAAKPLVSTDKDMSTLRLGELKAAIRVGENGGWSDSNAVLVFGQKR